MVETLFRFLFKYPPLMFQQGDFSWGLSRPVLLAAAAAAAIAVLALLTYRGVSATDRARDRVVLVGLRLAALAVLLFCLLRPALILKAAVPQQNFLGVLVDDSRSMAIADRDGRPRSAFVAAAADGPTPAAQRAVAAVRRPLLPLLLLVDRVASAADLKYAGTATGSAPALDRARDELAGLPLAGLVMVTDGADTSDAAIDEIARQPEGAVDSGVHRRRRPGALRARRPGDARRDAAQRRSRAPRSSSTSC